MTHPFYRLSQSFDGFCLQYYPAIMFSGESTVFCYVQLSRAKGQMIFVSGRIMHMHMFKIPFVFKDIVLVSPAACMVMPNIKSQAKHLRGKKDIQCLPLKPEKPLAVFDANPDILRSDFRFT